MHFAIDESTKAGTLKRTLDLVGMTAAVKIVKCRMLAINLCQKALDAAHSIF